MLYAKDANGNIRQVSITMSKNAIVVTTGVLNGKLKTNKKEFDKLPKKYESWDEYLTEVADKTKDAYMRKGYHPDLIHVQERKYNTFPQGEPMPMLLTSIDNGKDLSQSEQLVKIFDEYEYVFLQPKIYGERCISLYDDLKGHTLLSRGYQEYNLEHLKNQLDVIRNEYEHPLDGEIIVFNWDLGDIRSLIKNPDHPERKRLAYVIYDAPIVNTSFEQRNNVLRSISFSRTPNILRCDTVKVTSIEEVQMMHEQFLGMYGEGSVLRLPDSLYEFGLRSKTTLKLKPRMDEEFVCVGYYQRKNMNSITLKLKTKDNKEFSAKLKGNAKRIHEAIQNFDEEFLEKPVTVEFMKYSKHGLPLEPVAIGPRPERDS